MASSAFFHKPELALRRAIELEGIHQHEAALTLLHDILSSRRVRTWSPAFEQIMMAYLDLCLKLFKSREAKDGLHQYRNLSQSQAPGSLEKVIRYLMEQAEAKCTAAKAFVDAEATLASTSQQEGGGVGSGGGGVPGVDEDEDEEGAGDADAGEGFGASPQAILLSTMSTDPAKSQRDSALLLPALKFLWETYRAVLDILRSNSKLEHVYHAAAQGALKFCRLYKRRMEFRHLCDMLRIHLGNLRQYGNMGISPAEGGEEGKTNSKVRGWEGWTTESIELHLQTRFAQLETASVLHRYTEGFRTVEDIYNILQISQARRKHNPEIPPPKAKLMATYYEKLTTLFWVSENYLFHAFAWYKYYTLCIEYNRGMSEEMKRTQASAVLLAALCIPQLPHHHRAGAAGAMGAYGGDDKGHAIGSTIQDDIIKQKMGRMATLLGFHTRNPTREALLTEIKSKNILDQVPQYLRDLYLLLENDADPLVMVEKAQPHLMELRAQTGTTTLTDSEKLNDDVEDTTLGRYVKPLTKVLLLKLIVNLSQAYHTVSLDHLKKLTSGLDMSFEQVEKSIVLFTQQTKSPAVRIDHRAGCLRFGDAQLESDTMRVHLTVLSKQLEAVNRVLKPVDCTNQMERRTVLFKTIRDNVQAEHEKLLERKELIEKRKEEAERIAQEKIKEEQRIKAEEEAARRVEEEKRIAREQRLRELEKQRKIQQELENQEKKRFLAAMGKNADEISEQEIAKIDTEALQKEHQEKVNKKREEAERKTREAAKKLDYLVRAIRIEELPLIKKRYEEKTKEDRERYELETKEKVSRAKTQWEADVKDKAVLEEHGVFQYFAEFEEKVMVGRRAKHQILCKEAEAQAEIDAEKGKIARARKRKEDEIRRRADEEARRKKEEEEAKAEEERQKKEEAKREREAKDEERRAAELKRMDDERRKKESEQSKAALPPPVSGKYVPPSLRGKSGSAASSDRAGTSRFGGDAGGFGGGRYEGRSRSDDRGGSGDTWRGGGGSSDDRRSGSGFDRRDGGVSGVSNRFQDRGGEGGGGFRDRGGDGGGDRRGEGSSGNTRWRN